MNPEKPFVHLHVHSSYSLQDSTIGVKGLVKATKAAGMKAVALTDHSVMHGAITFYKACEEEGIKPIIGCEVNTCRDHKVKSRDAGPYRHLLLLAENDVGYANLARLQSIAHLEGFYHKPRVDLELLAQYHEGLIATSCCERGYIPHEIQEGNLHIAEQMAGTLRDIFGPENFFLELEDHGKESERLVNRSLIELSKKTGIPLVATNDVHYLKRAHAEAHELLLCMQSQTVMKDDRRLRFATDQYFFRSPDEMWELFGEQPDALLNTVQIANRCGVKLRLGDQADRHFPNYDVPEGHTFESYLVQVATEGIRRLYDGADITNPRTDKERELRARFDVELNVIRGTNYMNYFLVVWDFVRHAKSIGVPVGPGRGSGAGSLIAYAMGITAIDPLRYSLIFERFLNLERVSPPDFDIDFCQQRRGEVIDYVKNKYGHENCAQIVTFGTMGAKTVIRDIGRVLGYPLADCDRLAKLVPEELGVTLKTAQEKNPEFKQAIQASEEAKTIMRHAEVLEGLHRNQGTHAAGIVIGEKPLMDIVPLCRDKDNQAVAQYEMKPLEMTGLLKMDFLGLKTLTVIREALDHVKAVHGLDLDPLKFPLDDPETYALLERGDTVGVFQVESVGMRNLLRQLKANCLEDLIALISLYRPGPMDMIPDYIKRKHGEAPVVYPHPKLEPVLRETYGIFIYQEQVQQASAVLAGFSLAQGDNLRRAMGKKDDKAMEKEMIGFIQGCMKHSGMTEKESTEIFTTIRKFAAYGFNKSHSAAYAVVSYQTAYLKAHYPAEFMAATLSSEIGNTEKLTFFIAAVREMGMEVLRANVQSSTDRFRPENGNIRFGMAGVKGVGQSVVESLVQEREARGPFKSFMDFCVRVNPREVNKKAVESLVKCGAFDWTKVNRSRLFHNIDFAFQRAESTNADRASGQTSIFDLLDGGGHDPISDEELPGHEPWPFSTMLTFEKELIGFYMSGHPLDDYDWDLKHYTTHKVGDLTDLNPGTPVRVGGLVVDYVKRFTKKTQEPMGLFRIEGLDGAISAVMFTSVFQIYESLLANEAPVIAAGVISVRNETRQLEVHELTPLSNAARLYAKRVYLRLAYPQASAENLAALWEVCQRYRGITPMVFCLEYPGGQRVYTEPAKEIAVQVSTPFVREVEKILGEGQVYVQALETVCNRPPPKRKFQRRTENADVGD